MTTRAEVGSRKRRSVIPWAKVAAAAGLWLSVYTVNRPLRGWAAFDVAGLDPESRVGGGIRHRRCRDPRRRVPVKPRSMSSEETALQLKVLGSGCANCRTLEAPIVDTTHALGAEAPGEKVTDYTDIASYGVMDTPALAIDEQVVLAGRVPIVADLVDLISEATR